MDAIKDGRRFHLATLNFFFYRQGRVGPTFLYLVDNDIDIGNNNKSGNFSSILIFTRVVGTRTADRLGRVRRSLAIGRRGRDR